MSISEIQNWKQTVRDGAGGILAKREVPLSPNVSSVRQEAARFLQYVVNQHGDLKRSVESELESIRTWLSDLLARMNSSRDPEEIRRLRAPMSAAVTLSSYLEQTLETGRTLSVGEFIAEELEQEAAKMPAAWKEQADSLLRAAQHEREHGANRTIRVWDVPSEEPNRI
ncbi:MAG: hypothetical protein WB729_18340 [Candidatus Sulfotelmatobacter sp.]